MTYTPETLPEILEIRVSEEHIAKGGADCYNCPVLHALEACYPLESRYRWAVARHVIHLEDVSNYHIENLSNYRLPDKAQYFILDNDHKREVEPLSFEAKKISPK